MPKEGSQTLAFSERPVYVLGRATVAGQLESEGPLGHEYDIREQNDRLDGDTWEHSEQKMFGKAADLAIKKANLQASNLDFIIGGDLNAQLTSFYLGLRAQSAPSLGVYSACASICEALAIGAMMVDSGYANTALVGTSSHTSTAERQFRYPTEYGVQKPPTAQRTVTGSGCTVIGRSQADSVKIQLTHATIGRVVDYGITSPWEMGAAMAPAARDTILTHLDDTKRTIADYDCVATGDLGHIGHHILRDLFLERNLDFRDRLTDCGVLIYNTTQPDVFSGGSGGACCSLVTFAHLLKKLESGEWQRILVSATGALLSAVSAQQGDSIPCISHAVVFERKE